ncbi:hypothetical protein BZARG_766 [Bizionia argentinensis JUB59]|uniref:Uncharacterized protein n=1 Tax=Bizionia argentinensis JUB59 TaxID=1046627 RepID=G2EB83_9FLAO|nr:hypothetical protein [Bizionia argentinensis]EGV44386.1 hypothetical protein BZARG_766 [Bizionia argentinensis JUB59]
MKNNSNLNNALVFENINFNDLTDEDEIEFMSDIKKKLVYIKERIESEPKGEIQAFSNGVIMIYGFSTDLEYEIRMLLNI